MRYQNCDQAKVRIPFVSSVFFGTACFFSEHAAFLLAVLALFDHHDVQTIYVLRDFVLVSLNRLIPRLYKFIPESRTWALQIFQLFMVFPINYFFHFIVFNNFYKLCWTSPSRTIEHLSTFPRPVQKRTRNFHSGNLETN